MAMLLLKNGTVLTMGPLGTLKPGDVLIDKTEIAAVGPFIAAPADCTVIDVSGKYILPGFVDAHSHVGGTRMIPYQDDLNELSGPMHPELDARDGIDPEDPIFKDIIQDGITASCIVPGSGNVISGWGVVFKSAGTDFESRIVKAPAVLKCAVGVNPKAVYAAKAMAPMTRMSIYRMIRSYFRQVRSYMDEKDQGRHPTFDEGLEHGIPVLSREIPLKVHAYQHDMMSILELAREFDFDLTLDHAQGASDFLEELRDERVKGICFGPVVMGLGPGETCKADYAALPLLDQQGTPCAMITDGPIVTGKTLIYQLGEAVRAGMDPERALRMITIGAAEILGCQNRIGSLEPGKDADVLIYDGFPGRDVLAENQMTVSDGRIVWRKDVSLC